MANKCINHSIDNKIVWKYLKLSYLLLILHILGKCDLRKYPGWLLPLKLSLSATFFCVRKSPLITSRLERCNTKPRHLKAQQAEGPTNSLPVCTGPAPILNHAGGDSWKVTSAPRWSNRDFSGCVEVKGMPAARNDLYSENPMDDIVYMRRIPFTQDGSISEKVLKTCHLDCVF